MANTEWKRFKVAGVTFPNESGWTAPGGKDPMKRIAIINKYTGQWSKFVLVREPDNPYDKNAIQVRQVVKSGRSVDLGYVPRKLAAEMAPLMDMGWIPKVKFSMKHISDEGECMGLQLRYPVR